MSFRHLHPSYVFHNSIRVPRISTSVGKSHHLFIFYNLQGCAANPAAGDSPGGLRRRGSGPGGPSSSPGDFEHSLFGEISRKMVRRGGWERVVGWIRRFANSAADQLADAKSAKSVESWKRRSGLVWDIVRSKRVRSSRASFPTEVEGARRGLAINTRRPATRRPRLPSDRH